MSGEWDRASANRAQNDRKEQLRYPSRASLVTAAIAVEQPVEATLVLRLSSYRRVSASPRPVFPWPALSVSRPACWLAAAMVSRPQPAAPFQVWSSRGPTLAVVHCPNLLLVRGARAVRRASPRRRRAPRFSSRAIAAVELPLIVDGSHEREPMVSLPVGPWLRGPPERFATRVSRLWALALLGCAGVFRLRAERHSVWVSL